MISKKNNQGFTLVELLIATSIFSVIILAVSFTVIQISRLYYKSVVISRTQDAARGLTEEMSRPIQFEGSEIRKFSGVHPTLPDHKSVCIGTSRFTFVLGKKKVSSPSSADHIRHVIWRDEVPNPDYCLYAVNMLNLNDPNLESSTIKGRDVLTENMRVGKLEVVESTPGSGFWNVDVRVLYGEKDLMTLDGAGLPNGCKHGVVGSHWCANAEYKTGVLRRIRE